MKPDAEQAVRTQAGPIELRVIGPDAAALTPAELRRLFRGRPLTPERRARLRNGGRVIAACGSRVVGVAGYGQSGPVVRVHEFAVAATAGREADAVATALLDALEMACLAGGGRRLVVLPRAASARHLLGARGFAHIAEGSARSWFEKVFAP